jgi:hypothetical protein
LPQPLLIAIAESGTADDETARERLAALDDFVATRSGLALPHPLIRRFPGAGHNLMRYRPDDLAVALAGLWESPYQRS